MSLEKKHVLNTLTGNIITRLAFTHVIPLRNNELQYTHVVFSDGNEWIAVYLLFDVHWQVLFSN